MAVAKFFLPDPVTLNSIIFIILSSYLSIFMSQSVSSLVMSPKYSSVLVKQYTIP